MLSHDDKDGKHLFQYICIDVEWTKELDKENQNNTPIINAPTRLSFLTGTTSEIDYFW